MNIFSKKKSNTQEQSRSNLHIVLEHSGTPLYEMQTDEYSKEIIIGRSTDCSWNLEGVDPSASAKHAMISRRKNHFYITDLGSRNGIFYQNKRVKERKLTPGDKISLGECSIIVDIVEEKVKRLSQFHRLAYSNEKGRQIIVDISKPQMVLGSSADCDLIFHDQLISSQHAELVLKNDGSCWIRDLGSRNGTSVNGAELQPDSERMLQDNDVITIAYLDIKFWDASSEHHESRIWSAVIAIAITVIVILGIYIGYGKLTPDAPKLIEIATKAMQDGELKTAEEILTGSILHAEGAADMQYQREQLLRRIALWRNTQRIWASVQKDLNSRAFDLALQKISTISGDDLNAWSWPSGAVEKKKAAAIKNLLDSCSIAAACLKPEDMLSSIEKLEHIRRVLALALTEGRKYKDSYFKPTLEYAKPFLRRIDKTLKDNQELQKTLALLNVSKPDYSAVMNRLIPISEESQGPVKSRAARVLPAIKTLHRETQRTLFMVDKVCELDFKTVQSFKLDLPDGIDYSSEKNIGSLKNQLIDTVGLFKDTALQLSLIHGALVKRGIEPKKEVPLLPEFFKEDVMRKIYDVDSLNYPLPKSSRQFPAGEYDKILGIEFFYDYTSNVHTHSMTLNMEELSFKPKIYLLKQNFIEIEKFISFADKDENQWFNRGAFAEYLTFCKEILKKREAIVAKQLSRPDKPGTREFLISRGIAAYLSPEGTRKSDLELELGNSFSVLKRKILSLNREYNLAMPEEALQIRSKIIKTGLPGDPILKKMWQQRPAHGWGK